MGLLSEQRTMQKFTKHKIKTDLITPPPPLPLKKTKQNFIPLCLHQNIGLKFSYYTCSDEGGTIDVSGPFLCFFLHYRYKIRQKNNSKFFIQRSSVLVADSIIHFKLMLCPMITHKTSAVKASQSPQNELAVLVVCP